MRASGPALLVALVACAEVQEGPTSGSFSALTYNVQGLPDALSDSPRPTADRMVDISPFLEDYDVVGLQEDFAAEWHALLVAEAPHPVQHHMDDVIDDRVYGSGLSVLARVGEPRDYQEAFYSQCHGLLDGASDCLASKGFQILSLELADGVVVRILNTHHEAGRGPEDQAARASQVAEVITALGDGPALLLGDTNLRPSDSEDALLLAEYAAAGLEDACALVDCPEPDHIDRLMVRSGDGLTLGVSAWSREAHLVGADGEDLSDHPGIAAVITWELAPDGR